MQLSASRPAVSVPYEDQAVRLKEFVQETGGSTGNFLKIDPRLLQVRPDFNLRDLTTPAAREKLDILKAQIKAEGVLEALEIEFDGATPWINEGHRRHMVVMELIAEGEDIKTIPCVQERQGTDAAKRNLHMLMRKKEDYEPLEYAAGIARQINVYGWDKHNLARDLGFKSKASIEQYLDMLAMPEAVKAQVSQGQVSATAALKVTKETRDAKTDPDFAAQLIKDAADEQARLGKRGKATPKALKAASERAKPKPPATPKPPEPVLDAAELDASAPLPSGDAGAPVEGVKSLDQLKGQIAEITGAKPEDDAIAEQRRRDAAEFEAAAPTPLRGPRPQNRVDSLLCGFIAASHAAELASMYARLCRELEETKAESGDVMQGQEELCVAADVAGRLLFPDDWENAKATTELAQVA